MCLWCEEQHLSFLLLHALVATGFYYYSPPGVQGTEFIEGYLVRRCVKI